VLPRPGKRKCVKRGDPFQLCFGREGEGKGREEKKEGLTELRCRCLLSRRGKGGKKKDGFEKKKPRQSFPNHLWGGKKKKGGRHWPMFMDGGEKKRKKKNSA